MHKIKGFGMINSSQPNLVYDIGVNHGEDSLLYLRKGFKVIGVEASPLLAEKIKTVLPDYIASGQLVVENLGIMEERGVLPFYINLDCDHWSSFFKEAATRGNTRYETQEIQCINIVDLIKKHGCPYYMKIDVEGADQLILKSMLQTDSRPSFISVEEFGIDTFGALDRLGYELFSLRPQCDKSWCNSKRDTREGAFVDQQFDHKCSGLFGLDIPGWLDLDEARNLFNKTVRDEANNWLCPPGEFYDVHACFRHSLT